MWSLMMGSVYSSQSDLENETDSQTAKMADVKEILTTPEREEGDGMEKPCAPYKQSSTPEQNYTEQKREENQVIEIPEMGLVLDKLPPIRDKVEIPPKQLQTRLVAEKPRVFPRGQHPPNVKRSKEPKFVPYEPYKGAVAFMEETAVKKIDRKLSRTSRSTSVEKSIVSPKDERVDSLDTVLSNDLENNYRAMLDAKEKEISKLRENLINSEKQLKIQTKVNAEVKKLLVASVGEDIEARVDYLTQDKARLAADVIEYNNRIATDWEKQEALGVQSDVWRSKFLASTLIVEEITKNKQIYQQRAEDLEHLGRRLLSERNTIRSGINNAQAIIDHLAQSFDPMNTTKVDCSTLDIANATEHLKRSCLSLSVRLVGENKLEKLDLPPVHSVDSPAETELKKVLARPLVVTGKVPDQACNVLASNARLHLLKLGDMADAPHQHGQDQFQTCSHCSGTVQDI